MYIAFLFFRQRIFVQEGFFLSIHGDSANAVSGILRPRALYRKHTAKPQYFRLLRGSRPLRIFLIISHKCDRIFLSYLCDISFSKYEGGIFATFFRQVLFDSTRWVAGEIYGVEIHQDSSVFCRIHIHRLFHVGWGEVFSSPRYCVYKCVVICLKLNSYVQILSSDNTRSSTASFHKK